MAVEKNILQIPGQENGTRLFAELALVKLGIQSHGRVWRDQRVDAGIGLQQKSARYGCQRQYNYCHDNPPGQALDNSGYKIDDCIHWSIPFSSVITYI